MTRTVSATLSTATSQDHTKPIYLIRMGWDTEVRATTWDTDISWNGETWTSSGIEISGIDGNGGFMDMPKGDSDPWLALVKGEIPRGRSIEIYEYQTDSTTSPETSDAVLIFSGVMDQEVTVKSIRVSLIESATRKGFPPGRIDRPTYTHLLTPGTRIQWIDDIVIVN